MNTRNKRGKTNEPENEDCHEEMSDSEPTETNMTFDPIIYITGKEQNITLVRPQTIRNEINMKYNSVTKIEKAGRSLRVYCTNQTQKNELLNCQKLAEIDVQCTEPRRKTNKTNGQRNIKMVISGVPYDTEEQEIIEASGAKAIWRIKKKENGTLVNTTAVVLEYETESNIPERITIDYLYYRVRDYIPNPIRCYRCQKYGHTKTFCRSKEPVCARCAQNHLTEHCENTDTKKCASCGENHSTGYKKCRKYQEVRDTLKIATEYKMTYKEALLMNQSRTSQTNEINTETRNEERNQSRTFYSRTKYENRRFLSVMENRGNMEESYGGQRNIANEIRTIRINTGERNEQRNSQLDTFMDQESFPIETGNVADNNKTTTDANETRHEENTQVTNSSQIRQEIKTEDIRLIRERNPKIDEVRGFIKAVFQAMENCTPENKMDVIKQLMQLATTTLGFEEQEINAEQRNPRIENNTQ